MHNAIVRQHYGVNKSKLVNGNSIVTEMKKTAYHGLGRSTKHLDNLQNKK